MAAWRTLVRAEIEKRSHHLTFRILLVTGENPLYSKSTCGPVDCVALSPPTAVSTPRMAGSCHQALVRFISVLHMAAPHTCSLLRSVHINWTPRTVAARSSVLARGSEDGTSMELESGERPVHRHRHESQLSRSRLRLTVRVSRTGACLTRVYV